jgi:two-component system chemotaxis response regulator CheY
MINPKINALVVDDLEVTRKIICNILKLIGFDNIFEADSGTTALSILKEYKVGLIITDWNMPQMSGLELLQKIRANAKHQHIPVLMVTGEGEEEYILAALKAGADNYVVKPFTMETLKEQIETILKKHGA